MKAGDARKLYGNQLKEYNVQAFKLAQERNALKEKMKNRPNGESLYAQEAAKLELTYEAVDSKKKEYQTYMDQLMEQWDAKFAQVAGKQGAEAEKDAMDDLAKILTVARRIMHGDIVPPSDEKKLMEYDADLYQLAKNAQMLAQNRDKKKYKSLWEEEEEKVYEDPMEVADSQEAFASGPEVVSVEETMASVFQENE